MEPTKLGFDAQALARQGFTASASGLIGDGPVLDAVMSMMVHLARDTDRGLELVSGTGSAPTRRSAGFAGADKAAAMYEKAGFDARMAEAQAYELSVHDMTEFNHLAQFLPRLYGSSAVDGGRNPRESGAGRKTGTKIAAASAVLCRQNDQWQRAA